MATFINLLYQIIAQEEFSLVGTLPCYLTEAGISPKPSVGIDCSLSLYFIPYSFVKPETKALLHGTHFIVLYAGPK